MNAMYRKIENDPRLRGKIKMIGIGVGNSVFEVTAFKKKYKVPFPIFPDGNYALYNKLGKVRTPYFIAVKIDGDGSATVFYSKLGALGDPDKFLQLAARHLN